MKPIISGTCGALALVMVSLVAASAARAEEALPGQEQALARALVNHPDIVAAKAKVALAEAELYGKRMEVSRQIFELYGSLKMLEAQIQAAHSSLSTARTDLAQSRQESSAAATYPAKIDKLTAEAQAAEAQLVRLTAQQEQAEKELRLLVGSAAPAGDAPSADKAAAAARQAPQGPIVDQVKASLEAPVKLDFVDTPLSDVLTVLSENKLGVKFSLQVAALQSAGIGSDQPATIKTNEVRLRDALQAFEDAYPDLQFVVRDYGVLLTTKEYAREHGYTPLLELGQESVSTH